MLRPGWNNGLRAKFSPGMIALGRQIHRLGILANGNPAKAHVKGDIEVLGTWFTCVYTVMEEATWEAARVRLYPGQSIRRRCLLGLTPIFKPRGDEFKVESAVPFYGD